MNIGKVNNTNISFCFTKIFSKKQTDWLMPAILSGILAKVSLFIIIYHTCRGFLGEVKIGRTKREELGGKGVTLRRPSGCQCRFSVASALTKSNQSVFLLAVSLEPKPFISGDGLYSEVFIGVAAYLLPVLQRPWSLFLQKRPVQWSLCGVACFLVPWPA